MPYAEKPTVADWIEPSLPATALGLAADAGEPQDEMLGESAPEHTWVGKGFVWATYASVPGYLLALFPLLMFDHELGTTLGLLPMFLFFPVLMLWLARSVQVFDLRGWSVAMLTLLAMLLSGVGVLVTADSAGEILRGLITVPLAVVWLRYFGMRFPDFK